MSQEHAGADGLGPIAGALRHLAVPIDTVVVDPANARNHDTKNIEAIKGSLAHWGQRFPIVVQKQGMVVRAGNGRVLAAKALGWTHIAALIVDESDVEAVAFAIADNRSSDLSTFDDAALAKLLESLPDDALAATGFSHDDLGELLDSLAPVDVIEDEVPLPPDEAATRPGDRWILGEHVLYCGDSGNPADVDRLLGGAPVHLVNTDPPFNVAVEPRSNNAIAAGNSSFTSGQKMHLQSFDRERGAGGKPTHAKLRAKDRQLKNDAVKPEEYDRLLDGWFGNLSRVLLPGRAFYIWGGYSNHGNYRLALERTELYFSQCIVWFKDHRVLGRKDFMSDHEWCYYGWRSGAAHQFFGPDNVGDVWQVKKLNHTQMVHLTEKPVELAARAMQYSSKRGENVLDLFGGSGSTMMAAEQTGRKAFLSECDVLYCDVIVTRFQNATGKKAVLDGDGRTFEQVAAERTPAGTAAPEKAPGSPGAEEQAA